MKPEHSQTTPLRWILIFVNITYGAWVIAGPIVSSEIEMDEPIPATGGAIRDPLVFSDGANFFTLWKGSGVHGTHIEGTDGVTLYAPGVPIDVQTYMTGGFAGGHYLVVWETDYVQSEGRDIHGALIDSTTGSVINTSPLVITDAQKDQFEPTVASYGDTFLVVWSDRRFETNTDSSDDADLFATRVDGTTGEVLDPDGILVNDSPCDAQWPRAASMDGDFMVVWTQTTSYCDEQNSFIMGTKIETATGSVLDPEGFDLVSDIEQSFDGESVDLAASSASYLLTYMDYGGPTILSLTIDSDANVFAPPVSLNPDSFGYTADVNIEGAGKRFGASWIHRWYLEDSSTTYEVLFTRITETGSLIDDPPVMIAEGLFDIDNLSMGSNGSDFLLAWEDYRSSKPHIWGARLSGEDDNPVEAAAFPMVTAANDQDMASVSAIGNQFFVAWNDNRNRTTDGPRFYGTRIDGEVPTNIDTSGIPLNADDVSHPSVITAAASENYLVIYYSEPEEQTIVNAARVHSQTGSVLQLPPLGTLDTYDGRGAAATSNGEDFLVIFSNTSHSEIFGVRLTGAGEFIDLPPLSIVQTQDNEWYMEDWRIVSSGTDYLVAWIECARLDNHNTGGIADCRYFASRISSETGAAIDVPYLSLPGFGEFAATPDGHLMVGKNNDATIAIPITIKSSLQLGEEIVVSSKYPPSYRSVLVAALEDEYLIAWEYHGPSNETERNWSIVGRRVDGKTYTPIGDSDFIILNEDVHLSAVSGGTDRYLLAYEDHREGSNRTYARTVRFESCEIEGRIVEDEVRHPTNPCLVCDPLQKKNDWSADVGAPCDDGDPATEEDQCQEDGTCQGEELQSATDTALIEDESDDVLSEEDTNDVPETEERIPTDNNLPAPDTGSGKADTFDTQDAKPRKGCNCKIPGAVEPVQRDVMQLWRTLF